MADREAGSVGLWTLGLAVVVLTLGTLTIDLWSVLAARQQLAAIADATAVAAASGLDEEQLRTDGVVALDPDEAAVRATQYLAHQPLPAAWDGWDLVVHPDEVRVTVRGSVEGMLLPMLGLSALDVVVTSEAAPRLRP